MFDITISDIETAETIIANWATKAIGLIDPECYGAILPRSHYLQFYFHDSDNTEEPEYETDCHTVIPTKHHIERILAFSSTFTEDDRILVHCHAGISRSSAVAIAVFAQHGREPFEAFYAAERVCPEMYPNRLILQHADELLSQNGNLVGYLDIWLQNNRQRTSIKLPS